MVPIKPHPLSKLQSTKFNKEKNEINKCLEKKYASSSRIKIGNIPTDSKKSVRNIKLNNESKIHSNSERSAGGPCLIQVNNESKIHSNSERNAGNDIKKPDKNRRNDFFLPIQRGLLALPTLMLPSAFKNSSIVDEEPDKDDPGDHLKVIGEVS